MTAKQDTPETIKETLISIVIAFALAFVFRGFVIEAFVIPTGSMAPTLMGAHMKFRGAETGVEWAVNPWDAEPRNTSNYTSPQTGHSIGASGIAVYDPISGQDMTRNRVPLYSGDRILVLKYLYSILEPRRYDVVVFKNPTDPAQNYIKRLIGLPGEELALVDGDVFTRPATSNSSGAQGALLNWEQPGWKIARKPALQQRAVWQTVFDSGDAPMNATAASTPWTGDAKLFEIAGRAYTFAGGTGELRFDQTKKRFGSTGRRMPQLWTIDDYYSYDEHPFYGEINGPPEWAYARFPVSDVRVRLAVTPVDGPEPTLKAKLNLRGHEFELIAGAGKSEIRMRSIIGAAGMKSDWKTMSTGTCPPLAPGVPTNIEFWHSDQALGVWVERQEVCRAEYDWSPAERILFATGKPIKDLVSASDARSQNILVTGGDGVYSRPDVRLEISGGKAILHRVGLDRDLHYQPAKRSDGPGTATSPLRPLVLGPNDFFCCGDNSPASSDGRLWDRVDSWVDYEFRPSPTVAIREGIVPRELMLGRAFFVYWPSIRYEGSPAPVPDFGRMRFIW